MRRIRLISRITTVSLVGALALLATVVPSASGASYTFDVTLGRQCVLGAAPAGYAVHVTLRAPGGALLDSGDTTADPDGVWLLCFASGTSLDAGDKLRVSHAGTSHTLKLPNVTTAPVDRATDKVHGHGPAGRNVHIRVYDCFSPVSCAVAITRQRHVNASGQYALDLTGLHDVRGDELVGVWYQNGAGDKVRAADREVPWFEIVRGSSRVVVYKEGLSPVTMTLRNAAGTVRGRARVTSASMGTGDFRHHGHTVAVRAGDVVSGPFAADARMKVPAVTLVPDPTTDHVRGHCFPLQRFSTDIFHAPDLSSDAVSGTTDATGGFDTQVSDGDGAIVWDIQAGDVVHLACQGPKGDIVYHKPVTVP